MAVIPDAVSETDGSAELPLLRPFGIVRCLCG
jgi:hypothetical protein